VDELARARVDAERGAATIKVLGLNRLGLLSQRRDRMLLVDFALERIAALDGRIAQYPDDASFQTDLDKEKAFLAKMRRPGQPYSALVAQRSARSLTRTTRFRDRSAVGPGSTLGRPGRAAQRVQLSGYGSSTESPPLRVCQRLLPHEGHGGRCLVDCTSRWYWQFVHS
jgi:hypothetical protein